MYKLPSIILSILFVVGIIIDYTMNDNAFTIYLAAVITTATAYLFYLEANAS